MFSHEWKAAQVEATSRGRAPPGVHVLELFCIQHMVASRLRGRLSVELQQGRGRLQSNVPKRLWLIHVDVVLVRQDKHAK